MVRLRCGVGSDVGGGIGWDDRDRGFAGSMSRGGFSAVVGVNARVGGCGVNVLPS